MFMKNYLKSLLKNTINIKQLNVEPNASAQYGANSFYNSNKLEKEIIEPEHFEAKNFSAYKQCHDFSVLKGILKLDNQASIITILEQSGLSGCGGANFPVAVKWQAALANPGPRCLIINGQEGELYTFKDYMLMKEHAKTVVEGAALAALAIDASEVIIAINSGYIACINQVKQALAELLKVFPQLAVRNMRVVGGPKPDLYICGEETALIEYLENNRGEPQLKPPYPFQSGYKGRPTVVQNVETIAWLPLILQNKQLFAENGHLKLVHIYGAVNKPGIYQVAIGTSLKALMKIAGGIKQGSELSAIEVGGLAGGLLPVDKIECSFAHQEMSQLGAMVGTGSVNFLDQHSCLIDVALRAMEFFRNESCGRCTPCRVGTHELLRIADIMTERNLADDEYTWFEKVTRTMVNTSTCGLGKGAPSILVSLLRYWHVADGKTQLKQQNHQSDQCHKQDDNHQQASNSVKSLG
jgi:NADH:ubiquinone oxidoreductase subunit F (NADH-binding)